MDSHTEVNNYSPFFIYNANIYYIYIYTPSTFCRPVIFKFKLIMNRICPNKKKQISSYEPLQGIYTNYWNLIENLSTA